MGGGGGRDGCLGGRGRGRSNHDDDEGDDDDDDTFVVVMQSSARVLGKRGAVLSGTSRVQQQQQLLLRRNAGVVVSRSSRVVVVAAAATEQSDEQRLRLNNLSPQEGSRKSKTRKGRGYGAGQGGSAGYGMRGQKSRSGSGIRPGFEGGQTPLYRKLPKLKGIAGGMGAGLPDFVTVNVRDLNAFVEGGEAITLDLLKEKKILNLSGRDARLPLKILGTGELSGPVTVHAEAFSASARAKIESAGGQIVEVPMKEKWTRKAHEAAKAAAAAATAE